MTCQVIVTQEDNWFVATNISTNVASQGKTISEALANLKEAHKALVKVGIIDESGNYTAPYIALRKKH